MCTNYTNLNKAYPKDSYPLLSIDHLVDGAFGFPIISLLDAYFGYNQILMFKKDKEKNAFMIDTTNYCYSIMSFGLKNAETTYQRLMDKIFMNQLERNLEVYVDDMVVKNINTTSHVEDLAKIFAENKKI